MVFQSINNEILAGLLQTRWFGRNTHIFQEIDSTNRFLKEAPITDPLGTIAIAEHQSAGRGRLGRTWAAPPNTSILMSILIRPTPPLFPIEQFEAKKLGWLTMIAGLAAADALEKHSEVKVSLKWPNDLIVINEDGAWRKLGGILLELDFVGDQLNNAVLGMGLNINIPANQLPDGATPPTSLLEESGQITQREPLIADILFGLENWFLTAFSADAPRSPHVAWSQKLATIGRKVTINGKQTLQGTATGVDPLGNLLVRDREGRLHTISAGDVTLRNA